MTVQTQHLRGSPNLLLQDQAKPRTRFQRQDWVFHDSLCRRQVVRSTPQSLANPRTPYQAHNTADQEQAHNHSPDRLPPTKLYPPPQTNLEDRHPHSRSKPDAPLMLLLHLHKLGHRQRCHHNQQHQVLRREGRPSRHFHTHSSDGRHFPHIGKASHRTGFGDSSKTPMRFVGSRWSSRCPDKSRTSQQPAQTCFTQSSNYSGYVLLQNASSRDGSTNTARNRKRPRSARHN